MTSAELLTDAFDRIREEVHAAADGLSPARLAFRADPGANSIAWLLWHLTRVQDDHVAEVAGTAQRWTSDGWADRFALPLDPSDTGFGHDRDDVASVRVDSPDLLTGYHDSVHAMTVGYVGGLTDADLPAVVDQAWDPPVTLAVRLVSVIADCLQHTGQAAFVRGLTERG